MISGKYLGEITRLALKSLIGSASLFRGKLSTKFDTFEAFETKYLSIIEGGYVDNLGLLLKKMFRDVVMVFKGKVIKRKWQEITTL